MPYLGSFQSLTRDSNHSNGRWRNWCKEHDSFNPSRGIAIIQTGIASTHTCDGLSFQSLTRDSNHSNYRHQPWMSTTAKFQSLTRDSNHSNWLRFPWHVNISWSFNPSRGIAIIQTIGQSHLSCSSAASFNPSRGIAIIQTTQKCFVMLVKLKRFNPSRGIAIIQTPAKPACVF